MEDEQDLRLVETKPLRYLLSIPHGASPRRARPVLCFLHGFDEASPLDIRRAITRHGPLRKGNPPDVRKEFIIVAPQLPVRGDIWYQYADAVRAIVDDVRHSFRGDAERTYLTGFSFGGNGVFDLAMLQLDLWAALWPVDPTRIPGADPGKPVWMSFGEVSRRYKNGFIQALGLASARVSHIGDRLYLDEGEDHVGSAELAYRDERIYSWLLAKKLIS
jgi:hypothetical protein